MWIILVILWTRPSFKIAIENVVTQGISFWTRDCANEFEIVKWIE